MLLLKYFLDVVQQEELFQLELDEYLFFILSWALLTLSS